MATDDDIARDRGFAISAAFLLVAEVALGALADGGTIPIWLWLVLAVAAVGVTALLSFVLSRR